MNCTSARIATATHAQGSRLTRLPISRWGSAVITEIKLLSERVDGVSSKVALALLS